MFVATYMGSIATSMAAYCACQACQCASREVLRHSARLAYSVLFFLSIILSWVLRDFAKPLLEKLPWIVKHATELTGDSWYGQQAVFRLSLGNFLFFGCMSLAMLGVKFKNDKRDVYLQHGNWLVKLGVWLIFCTVPFFFPNELVNAYGWAARFGAGIFLVIQMIILLDFVQYWNESWVEAGDDDNRWLYGLLAVTVTAYAAVITMAVLMFMWFKPAGAGSCSLNMALVSCNLVLAVVFAMVALYPHLHPSRQGNVFPASAIALYCTYLCFSALQSEPRDYECNGLAQHLTATSGSTMALGMVATIAAVVYSAFRAGSNTHIFSLEGSDGEPETTHLLAGAEQGELIHTSAGLDGAALPGDESSAPAVAVASRERTALDDFQAVTYNYSFFHLIFALASMYIAMLMTGWGTVAQEKDRLDVGWASVWVKTAAQWVTGLLYIWSLAAPSLFPDRDFS